MASKRIKKQRTTLEKLKFWKGVKRALLVSEFAMPAIPFGIIVGINWSDWFGKSATEGWSIGMGFGMLIVATVSAIIGIWKEDEIVKSKLSGIFYVALILLIFGFGLKLIASVFNAMGDMFLYVAVSVVGSGAVAQVNKSKVCKEVARYEKLVKDNGLDKKSAREIDDEIQAQQEGEQARSERVRFIPHD